GFTLSVIALLVLTLALTGQRYSVIAATRVPDYPQHSFTKLQARAQQNDIPAELELGKRYRSGFGTSTNTALACEWFQKAADAGDLDGALWLARTRAERLELPETVAAFYRALQINTNSVKALNGLAWLRATAPDNSARD